MGKSNPLLIQHLKDKATAGDIDARKLLEALEFAEGEFKELNTLRLSSDFSRRQFDKAKKSFEKIKSGSLPLPGEIYHTPGLGYLLVLSAADATSYRVITISSNTHFAMSVDVLFTNPLRKQTLAAHTRISGVVPADMLGVWVGEVTQSELSALRQLNLGKNTELPEGMTAGTATPDELYFEWRAYLEDKLTSLTEIAIEDYERSNAFILYFTEQFGKEPSEVTVQPVEEYSLAAADTDPGIISHTSGPVLFERSDRIRVRADKSGSKLTVSVVVSEPLNGPATILFTVIGGKGGTQFSSNFSEGMAVIIPEDIAYFTAPIRTVTIISDGKTVKYE